jgi:hypothetical protein
MLFSPRMRPNFFAASMNAGLLPGPEAQYTQIDLIVLMGKGCGVAGASRQGAPCEWSLPGLARRKARERAYAWQSTLLAKIVATLTRGRGPRLTQGGSIRRVGFPPFGVLVVRKRLYMRVVRRGCACGPSLPAGV